MPFLPSRPCRFSGCPNTVSGKDGYCFKHKEHEKSINRQYSKDRGQSTPDNFYQSQRWIKFRNWYRSKHPLCERCLGKDIIESMKIVDHIIPRDQGGEDCSEENSQSLCQSCHNLKTAEDKKKYNV